MRRGQPLPWQVALTVALRGPDTVMFESHTPWRSLPAKATRGDEAGDDLAGSSRPSVARRSRRRPAAGPTAIVWVEMLAMLLVVGRADGRCGSPGGQVARATTASLGVVEGPVAVEVPVVVVMNPFGVGRGRGEGHGLPRDRRDRANVKAAVGGWPRG